MTSYSTYHGHLFRLRELQDAMECIDRWVTEIVVRN